MMETTLRSMMRCHAVPQAAFTSASPGQSARQLRAARPVCACALGDGHVSWSGAKASALAIAAAAALALSPLPAWAVSGGGGARSCQEVSHSTCRASEAGTPRCTPAGAPLQKHQRSSKRGACVVKVWRQLVMMLTAHGHQGGRGALFWLKGEPAFLPAPLGPRIAHSSPAVDWTFSVAVERLVPSYTSGGGCVQLGGRGASIGSRTHLVLAAAGGAAGEARRALRCASRGAAARPAGGARRHRHGRAAGLLRPERPEHGRPEAVQGGPARHQLLQRRPVQRQPVRRVRQGRLLQARRAPAAPPCTPPPPPPQQHSSPAVQGSVALALLADPAIAGSAQATATHAGCLQVAGLSTRQPEHHCSGLSPFELMAF